MDGNPTAQGDRKIYVTKTGRILVRRSQLVRPKEKNVGSMKDIGNDFSNPGELVVDQFSYTFTTTKVCLYLPRNHRLKDREIDSDYLISSTEALVKTYARQVLIKK